jgi:hypothetical protein
MLIRRAAKAGQLHASEGGRERARFPGKDESS